ncbi:TIGR04219 family outer membrane beta-barrel protein [Thaumasiovibrio subtropicus]|uniref:TIGR04219 family outer membrane beta-barrel protein n=1 Tax=Thaumasiovibrio subtropicus TaxID=1891207 RepID=UPI000B357F86|nr:TIGR04219 family outer membrane beta-barrel protein [Thaumasiovibrio subtropicus]
MKKFSLAMLALVAALPAQADMFLGAKVGADFWGMDAKVNNVKSGDDAVGSFYVAVEHFIPLVPNVRLRQTNLDTRGIAFNQTDITAYYEILDNDLISFDLGLNIANLSSGRFNTQQFSDWQPGVYGNVEIGIPATNLTIFTDLNFSSFNKTSMVDGQAGVMYSFGMYAFDMKLRAGYRAMDYDMDWISGDGEVFNRGPFAGIEFDF